MQNWSLNKIIIIDQNFITLTQGQQMALSVKKSMDATLENLLQKVKPKARYISELHVDEYNDSIYKEIINGDIQIPKERQSIDKKQDKYGFQDVLRKKFLSQIEKQKQTLEHKLGYISNSINSMKKYDELRAAIRSPLSMRSSFTIGPQRGLNQEWREEIRNREKQLSQKKRKVQQQRKKKKEEMKQFEARLKEQQNEKKKKQILEKMKMIQSRMKSREEQVKEGNQKIIKLKKQQHLHDKINQSFQLKEQSYLEEQKKKLAEIRSLKKPIDQNELKEHEIKFLQLKKQKQELRQRERKMNQSRMRTYKPTYEGVFYKKILEDEKTEEQNISVIKSEKMKQFAEHVKEHFVPDISEKKKQQLEQILQKEKRKQQMRQERQKELLQKSKVKGMQYLQMVRNIPKKKRDQKQTATPLTDRIKYHNYLTHHSQNTKTKQPWTRILNSSADKQHKAIKIQIESQKKQQELKRRQQHTRLLKQGDSSQIDEEYFKMIKAKLDFLQE